MNTGNIDNPQDLGFDIDLFDESNPRSLINIVWEDFKPVLKRAQTACPELFDLPEAKLFKKVDPDPMLRMLRNRFWQEYDRVQFINGTMMLRDVIRGVCPRQFWNRNIAPLSERVAFIIIPPVKYMAQVEDLISVAMDVFRDILQMPNLMKDGEIDYKLIDQKRKIFETLEPRAKGAVIQRVAIQQRIDQRTQITTTHDPKIEDPTQLDAALNDLDRQIEQARSQQFLQLPEVIDVTPAMQVTEEAN